LDAVTFEVSRVWKDGHVQAEGRETLGPSH
jgi:hypothetical protein